ncbi:AAA family ATPase [Agromyces silvae]|uniref:AAA family ATPase n=1 Tax=Agromyces silvae TaxID=3388266 RepID=UPI00280AD952|nr:AAA family ATPase [Agromyces protaetiae]
MHAADDRLNDGRAIRRVVLFDDAEIDVRAWPANVPAIAQVIGDRGLEFGPGITFLVGENGSGKSTLLEGIATAYGLPPEGGSSHGGRSTRPSESSLGEWLRVERSPDAPRWGFFLRAETMHGYYTYLDSLGGPGGGLHEMSHGESFNALLDERLNHPRYTAGLVCLDEPEAALSFASTLTWVASLHEVARRGTQVICATHSPILASVPGATILELGEWGIRRAEWADLDIVTHWRSYLSEPERYLRHLLA